MPPGFVKDEDKWQRAKALANKDKNVAPNSPEYWALTMYLYKKLDHKEAGDKDQPGVHSNYWFWASDKKEKSADTSLGEMPDVISDGLSPDERCVSDLIVQNPEMSAATFYNMLKAKGYKVVNTLPDVPTKEDKKEADSATTSVATARAGTGALNPIQKKKKESIKDHYTGGLKFRLKESSASDNGIGPTRFEAVLIQEGLGNMKDLFYYSREALESAVSVFEGKKFYADHPDKLQEQVRPERSVRDICGYFEKVRIEEGEEGQAMLVGDVVTFPDEPFRWARALLREAIVYQDKHPDKELVGLSINASGDAQEMDIQEFMEKGLAPKSAIPKLQKAIEAGATSIRIVSAIADAVSCDLVTEAGAGGKLLEMIEREKEMGKQAKHAEDEKSMKMKKEADADGDAGHADADQDKELVAKMLKKHLGDDSDDHDMKQAHQAYEYMKQAHGYDAHEAAKHAAEAIKMAKHMAAKHAEAKHDDADKKESSKVNPEGGLDVSESKGDKTMEAEIVRLKGQVAFLEAKARKSEIETYVEEKCRKSGLPTSITKAFKETIAAPKSKEEVDYLFNIFCEGKKTSAGGEVFLSAEKTTIGGGKTAGLADCLKD